MQYLDDEKIKDKKEIVINRPKRIGFESFDGSWHFEDAPELDYDTLMRVTRLLAERMRLKYEAANPILSCILPGGHRGQVVAGDQIDSKFSFTIRLFSEREFTLEDFGLNETDRQTILDAVSNKKTLLISGGTGSGKTSFLNVLIKHIPKDERLVTLEDVRELKVEHENWCGLVFSNAKRSDGTDSALDLLNATLRMRPDRILLGEIRKENGFAFCSAINTGHAGSMATIHANDPESALDAVINRVLLNGDIPESAISPLKRQLKSDIYGVVQLDRKAGGVEGYFQMTQDKTH